MKREKVQWMAVCVASLALTGSAMAQSYWAGGAGTWSSDSTPGWNETGVPNAIDAVADTSALMGNVTVDGTYTVGTLHHQTLTGRAFLASGGASKLVFDVTAGSALLDLGSTFNAGASWTTDIQLNDPLLITYTNSTAAYTLYQLNLYGVVSGTGGITTDIRGAINAAYYFILALTNKNNSFSGGITTSSNTVVQLYGENTAGTGPIVLGNNTSIRLYGDQNFVLVNDIRTPNSTSYTMVPTYVANMTVTMRGNITGSGSARLGPGNAAMQNVTYILQGTNDTLKQMYVDPISAYTTTIQIDHIYSLPKEFYLRGLSNATPKLILNAAGTYTQKIAAVYGFTASHSNFTGYVGTKDTFTGAVVLDSPAALDFSGPTNGMIFAAGNVGATLELKSQLTDLAFSNNVFFAGPGTVVVSRATGNAYDGTTAVQSGTLIVNGVLGGAGAVTVDAGATLGGTGTVTGATTVYGTLKPGNSPGELNFSGNLTLMGGSTNVFEINGTSNADYDYVNAVGALTYGGTLLVNFGYTPAANAAFQLFDFGSQSGTFSSIQATGAYTGDTDFNYTTGVLTVIPEPGTLSILGFGLVATLLRRKLRKI